MGTFHNLALADRLLLCVTSLAMQQEAAGTVTDSDVLDAIERWAVQGNDAKRQYDFAALQDAVYSLIQGGR